MYYLIRQNNIFPSVLSVSVYYKIYFGCIKQSPAESRHRMMSRALTIQYNAKMLKIKRPTAFHFFTADYLTVTS